MKTIYRILILSAAILFSSCATIPYNPSKPEMSVPENNTFKNPPKTFNQFRNDWVY